MTVKSLSATQKHSIAEDFKNGVFTIDGLAVWYFTSRRTIIRVLEEQGCAPPVKKRNRKPKETPPVQISVVIPTKTPWWKKIFTKEAYVKVGFWPGPRA